MTLPERTRSAIVGPDTPVRDALRQMDARGMGVLLITGDDLKLAGVLTDGDIRRAILRGTELDGPVSEFMNREPLSQREPVTSAEALQIMNSARSFLLNQLPVVDEQGRVVDLLLRRDLSAEPTLPVNALVMAGGYGTRLKPLTDEIPKPMLLVGGKPIIERIIERLREAGIRRVGITTHYKAETISRHFGDGGRFGVHVDYLEEHEPLGTAGALNLLEPTGQPVLVVNGDILTKVDYRAMFSFHEEQEADMTIAVRQHEVQVPYGVVQIEGMMVTRIVEKPVDRHFVSAGIYIIDPSLLRFVPKGKRYDMPDLIARAIDEGLRVGSFPVREYWVDIGSPAAYRRAQADLKKGRFRP